MIKHSTFQDTALLVVAPLMKANHSSFFLGGGGGGGGCIFGRDILSCTCDMRTVNKTTITTTTLTLKMYNICFVLLTCRKPFA